MKKLWKGVKKCGAIVIVAIMDIVSIPFLIRYFKAPKSRDSKKVVKQKINDYTTKKDELNTKSDVVKKTY